MVEDERALMELRLVGLREGCNVGIKEEHYGEFGVKLSDEL
jgi:hypothetical protein